MCHARYEKSLKKTHPRVVAKNVETYSSPVFHILFYGRIPITRTFKKGNIKQFELSRVKLNRKRSEGNENCFELAGGSSYRETTVLLGQRKSFVLPRTSLSRGSLYIEDPLLNGEYLVTQTTPKSD